MRLKTARVARHYNQKGGRYDYEAQRNLKESDWLVGTFVTMDGDFVYVQLANDTVAIARDSISTIEKSLGIETHKGTGELLGFVIGIPTGALLGYALGVQSCDGGVDEAIACTGEAVVYAIVGIIVGGTIGYFAGGAIGNSMKYENWEPVRGVGVMYSLRLGGSSRGSPLRVGLAVGF